MNKILLILFIVYSSLGFSQDVELMIFLRQNGNPNSPYPNKEVKLISEGDTLTKKTNLDGLAFFSRQGSDSLITISFKKNTSQVNGNGISLLYEFLTENENLTIELIGEVDKKTDEALAKKRANVVRDSLISLGIYYDRLFIGGTTPLEDLAKSKTGVTSRIITTDYYPCTGLGVINFKNFTDTIVETRCDSLKFIYDEIMSSNEVYAIIGLYYIMDDDFVFMGFAEDRAQLVIQKLIAMGVPKNRMKVYTQYYAKPKDGDYRDWPFYPNEYTYEIGVILNLAP